jgi:hypothetical protein
VYKFPLLLLFFSLPSATGVAQSSARKVAIIDGVTFKAEPGDTVREADHFYKVVTQKLTAKGWAPIPPVSESVCRHAVAAGGDCLGYVAHEAEADYVLRVTGDGNLMEGYSLRVEVYSPRTLHTQKTTNLCDVCVTDGIAQSTATISLDLLADAVKDDADTERERRLAGRDLVSGPSVSEPTNLSWIPWSMVGVGSIGIGIGTWWLSKNGSSKDLHPASASPVLSNDYYSSKSLGLASVLGGAAMAAGGILWIALSPSSSASVIASPNHVAFNLRY